VDLVTDILTPLQKNVLTALYGQEWFREHFYLTGGTALAAFSLRHRFSDDLDFFSHEVSLDAIDGLMRAIARQFGLTVTQLQKSPGFLRYEVNEELKVDFVGDVPFRVGTPGIIDSFVVDSVKNIAVNKVCAILGRLEAKDYVDLYFSSNTSSIFSICLILVRKRMRDWSPLSGHQLLLTS
jgi:predicted nucleotidyltransferase component of viral defense system